jgi:hypothetical protein
MRPLSSVSALKRAAEMYFEANCPAYEVVILVVVAIFYFFIFSC